jgi:phage shock protein PspC (stress-responsive transcriptional regulator)
MKETNPENADSPKRLTRSRENRYIGGVAAGIANYFNLDPVLIRVAFAISIAFGGVGVLAYLALLIMVPIEGGPGEPAPQPEGGKRLAVIGGAIALGAIALISIGEGGLSAWLYGIGPGALFCVLIWLAATVEAHASSVLRKLQLSTRHELSRWAAERDLID